MQQNFYIPDEKKDLIDRVQELSDKDSLSATIVEALEEFIDYKLMLKEGYEKVILQIPQFDSDDDMRSGTKTVKFIGRLLNSEIIYPNEQPRGTPVAGESIAAQSKVSLYRGKKGGFLLLWKLSGEQYAGYTTGDSLKEIKNKNKFGVPDEFIEEAKRNMEQKNIETIELDL